MEQNLDEKKKYNMLTSSDNAPSHNNMTILSLMT